MLCPSSDTPELNSSAPWQTTGLFEGDIYVTLAATQRNGLIDPQKRWINGTIPYVIDKSFGE